MVRRPSQRGTNGREGGRPFKDGIWARAPARVLGGSTQKNQTFDMVLGVFSERSFYIPTIKCWGTNS